MTKMRYDSGVLQSKHEISHTVAYVAR